jgi:sulfate transport system permease protein
MEAVAQSSWSPVWLRSLQKWGSGSLRATAIIYLTVLLIIPLGILVYDGWRNGLEGIWSAIRQPEALGALRLTFWVSAITALINAVMGTLTAYVLARYNFAGKQFLNTIIELPLALPTLISGLTLLLLFGPQTAVGSWFSKTLGIRIIYAQPGIILALLFVTLPFVVRAVYPILITMDRDPELAAATLGANGWTIFWRVTLPVIIPSLVSGTVLTFSRAMGEFGAVVLVAGNFPGSTLTAAVYVQTGIESVEPKDQLGASAISLVLLAIAFTTTLIVEAMQHRIQKKGARS